MYSISEHVLQFSDDYETLYVKDDDNNSIASFDLTESDPPYGVRVIDDEYVISAGLCEGGVVVFAIDLATESGSMNFEEARLGGLNIIDLRDTGKLKGEFSIDISCGPVGLQCKPVPWGFEVLVSNDECILYPVFPEV